MTKSCLGFLQPLHCLANQLHITDLKHSVNQIGGSFNSSGNKTFTTIQISTFLFFTIQIFINQASLLTGMVKCFLYLAMHICLLFARKYSPIIFTITCTMLWTICGPISLSLGQISIQSAYLMTLTTLILQHLYVKNSYLLTFQMGIQLTFLCTIYHDSLIGSITYERPEEFAHAFRTAFLANILFFYAIIILMSRTIPPTHSHTTEGIEEKKGQDDQKTFILSLSHELRNLTNSLVGSIRLANLEKALPIHIKDLLANTEVCGDLMLHLVNNVLDSGKIENGQLEADLVPTEVPTTFGRIWSICSKLINQKGLECRLRIQRSIPQTLKMDYHKVAQILLNLVNNSLKFTDAGSINMNVQWIEEAGSVTEKSFQPYPFNDGEDDQEEGLFEKDLRFQMLEDEYLEGNVHNKTSEPTSPAISSIKRHGILKIIISDTGCGMTKQDTHKLFQKFSQVGSDASKKKLGTGLGLFISKQLCEKMGGEIKVYSKKDEGTCFILCLPVQSC